MNTVLSHGHIGYVVYYYKISDNVHYGLSYLCKQNTLGMCEDFAYWVIFKTKLHARLWRGKLKKSIITPFFNKDSNIIDFNIVDAKTMSLCLKGKSLRGLTYWYNIELK